MLCVTNSHVLSRIVTFVLMIVTFCVTDCHVLRHCFSCLLSRIVMFCVTNCHFSITNCHVCVNDCHVLSRIVMFCVTSCHVFCHGLSCFVSQIVMFVSRIVMFVSRIVTFCVTDYLLGFDLCSVAVHINASAEHISSIFTVKYAPLWGIFTSGRVYCLAALPRVPTGQEAGWVPERVPT